MQILPAPIAIPKERDRPTLIAWPALFPGNRVAEITFARSLRNRDRWTEHSVAPMMPFGENTGRQVMIKWMRAIFFVLLVVCFSSTVAASSYGLGPYVAYTDALNSWPSAVAVGDVSGDGRADAILATTSYDDPSKAYQLFIYAQTAQGSLAAPLQLPYVGVSPMEGIRMQLADLNGDGLQDIVVGHLTGITVFLSLGHMRFARTNTDLPGNMTALAVADLNGDRHVDVVWQSSEGDLQLLMGNGRGGFASIHTLIGSSAWHQALRIGDVTGDGLPDLVLTNQQSLTIYPGKGTGEFKSPRVVPYPDLDDARGFSSVAIADVNHDGRNDVLATTSANQPRSKIWIFAQTGTGTLARPQIIGTYDNAEALTTADLDHDGYTDVLTMHGGWYRMGYYLQGRQGLAAESGAYVPYATQYSQHGLATGDLNGDGCTDAAIADYNNGLLVLAGNFCHEPLAMANRFDGDFNGDGKSDILWHNAATGASTIWTSGDSATQVALTRITDTSWTIAGVGDFNGDGKSDVLWRHVLTGKNVVWRSGDYGQSTGLTGVNDLNWEIAGIGDFDGNGKDDILWRHTYSGRNAVWEGGYYSNRRSLTSVTDTDWKVSGVGDFDGNGKADILWRHAADGRNVIWRNADYSSAQAVSALTDLGWQVAGLGDFDNDGRADILWRNAFDGRSSIWHAADSGNTRPLTRVTKLSWKVAGIGDYAGDGRSDVLWRNSSTGNNTIWRDANSAAGQEVTSMPDMNWMTVR